jgi:hypothetical protein
MHNRVKQFIILSKPYIDYNISFKDKSLFMKILSYLLFFVPNFSKMTTTIGKTIYFPNEEYLDKVSSLSTLAHEIRHIHDEKKMFLYKVLYLFPQSLSFIFFLLSFWSLWFLIPALVSLSPLPAIFRKKIEINGYITTLFISNLLLKEQRLNVEERKAVLLTYIDRINQFFTGPTYYFMWVFGVKSLLLSKLEDILNEKLEKDDVFYYHMKECFDGSLILLDA